MMSSTLEGELSEDTLYTLGHIQEYDEYGSSGVLIARGGGKFIRFHRFRVFINGVKFYSDRFLWQSLRLGTLLKVFTNVADRPFTVGKIQTNYNALIAWTGELPCFSPLMLHTQLLTDDYIEEDDGEDVENFSIDSPVENLIEMMGSIYWCCGRYGLVAVRRDKNIVFVLFDPSILYINGTKFDNKDKLQVLCAKLRQCQLYARHISPQNVFGVTAEYEAVLMWRGKKPPLRFVNGREGPHKNPPAYMKSTFNSYGNSSFKQPLLANPQRPHVQNFYPTSGNNARYPNSDIHRQYKSLGDNNPYKQVDKYSSKENTNPNSYYYENKSYYIDNISNGDSHYYEGSGGYNNGIYGSSNEYSTKYNSSAQNAAENKVIKELALDKPDDNIKVSYFTGTIIEAGHNIAIYGGFERAAVFHRDNFYMYGEKLPPNQSLHNILMKCMYSGVSLLHSYVSEIEITPVLNWYAQWRAKYVWLGPAPPEVKEALASLTKIPLNIRSVSKYLGNTHPNKDKESGVKLKHGYSSFKTPAIEASDIEYLLVTNKESMATEPEKSVSEDEVRGYVLTADENECIMTSFTDIVVFGRRKFFVNGKKFDKNGSLLEFFQGESMMVHAWIVPLNKPRIALNCIVYSRAICAWTGKPPEDLERLKQEYYNTKEDNCTNTLLDLPFNGFHYFIGRLIFLDSNTQQGILCCGKENKLFNVVFNKTSVYKHGVKINEKHIVQNYTLILGSSRWSVLAKKVHSYYVGKVFVDYEAIAVWHFQNQNQLFDEFNQKLPIWAGPPCSCRNTTSELYEGAVLQGKVFTQDGKNIVFEIFNNEKVHTFAKIKKKNLWIDCCRCAFSSADEKRKCYMVCLKLAEPEHIHGIEIIYEASVAWIGVKPEHIMIDNTIPIDDSFEEEDDNYYDSEEFEDDYDYDNSNYKTVSAYDPSTNDDHYNTPFQCILKSNKLRTHKYSGRHVHGHIKSLYHRCGIAEWQSQERGLTYIVFDTRFMFVDGIRLSQKKVSDILYERSCHLYIVPVSSSISSPMKHNGVTVNIQATVGWIGRKPPFIPGPGLQEDHDIVVFSELNSTYQKSYDNGYHKVDSITIKPQDTVHIKQEKKIITSASETPSAKQVEKKHQETTTAKPSVTAAQKLSFISSENTTSTKLHQNKTLPEVITRDSKYLKLPEISKPQETLIKLPENNFQVSNVHDYTERTLNTEKTKYDILNGMYNDSMLNTPDYLPFTDNLQLPDHLKKYSTDEVSKLSMINLNDNYEIPSSTPVAITHTQPSVLPSPIAPISKPTARIVELHSKIGVIMTTNNEKYYFNSNQCYLYGASLKDVELWHVLIKEIGVNYQLTRSEIGTLVCEEVWIGERKPINLSESIKNLYEWCNNNIVPDKTRNMLVSQLQS